MLAISAQAPDVRSLRPLRSSSVRIGLARMHVDLVGVGAAGNADHAELLHAPLLATARCRRRHRSSGSAPRPAASRHSRRRSPPPCRCPSRSRARCGRPARPSSAPISVIFSGLPMVPAGKIWNLTLPPVSASACLEKPCANCSRCMPPGQDVAMRTLVCALAPVAHSASEPAATAASFLNFICPFLPVGPGGRDEAPGHVAGWTPATALTST